MGDTVPKKVVKTPRGAIHDPFEGWDRQPDGSVTVYPLAGWEAWGEAGGTVGLRVHYAATEEALDGKALTKLPLIMTPILARKLAERLISAAARAERTPTLDA